jgi:hypothetical protein
MKHVVMFSGGVGSWAAAKRVAERHGTDNLTLLFADTHMEDEDLYRFLFQAAANVGGKLVKIADGRTPWEVFFKERFLGNSLVDPCSKILKREFMDRWRNENCDQADTICHLGIDWTEIHRLERTRARVAPWRYEAPLPEAPYQSKRMMLDALKAEGIAVPRLYEMGFSHNNCGGFCVKAGVGHFMLLLNRLPERFAYHEGKEQEIRDYLQKDVSILEKDGKPFTLRALRLEVEAGRAAQLDLFDIGGCGCAA